MTGRKTHQEDAGLHDGKRERAASPAPFSIDSVRDRVRRYSYQPITADEKDIRAAVLVPLYQLRGELHVILTKRTTLVSKQQGHISFPGGRRESADQDL